MYVQTLNHIQKRFTALKYLQGLDSIRGVFILLAIIAQINVGLIKWLLQAEDSSEHLSLQNILSFGRHNLKSLAIINGIQFHNLMSFRYHQPIDLVQFILQALVLFCGQHIIPLMLQLSMLDIDVHYHTSASCTDNQFYNMFYRLGMNILIIFIFAICFEVKRRYQFKISVGSIFFCLWILVVAIDVINVGKIAFDGGTIDRLSCYHEKQNYNSLSLISGIVIASLMFVYKFEPVVGQQLLVQPNETVFGRQLHELSQYRKIMPLFYLVGFAIQYILSSTQQQSTYSNPVLIFIQDIGFRSLHGIFTIMISCISLFVPIELPNIIKQLGMIEYTVINMTQIVIKLNMYVFKGIEFGPYSDVTAGLLLIGVMMESLIGALLCHFGFIKIVRMTQKRVAQLGLWLSERN